MTTKKCDVRHSESRPPNPRNCPSGSSKDRRMAVLFSVLLAGTLALLFFRSVYPQYVIFSNDGPLGAMVAQQNRMPTILTGMWTDLNWIGGEYPAPSPTISSAIRLVTSPFVFSKIYAPVTLFILGLCAWFCFRRMGLAPLACVLGGFAAALSSHFFSTACWGVAAQAIGTGMIFVAIGLVGAASNVRNWINIALAGMAVGLSVMEGYDVGAIFSLFVAAFVLFHTWTSGGTAVRKLTLGIGRVVVVALCAGIVAAHAVTVLVSTQIKGVVGTEQTPQTKAKRWDWATQWSYPPSETLRIIVPGLFGYRMDTPKDMAAFGETFEGGVYWGQAGRDPEWDRYFAAGGQGNPPRGFLRFSGGGEYAGLLVVALALWAMVQSFRRSECPFKLRQRQMIWFWGGVAILSLLLAYGRYAPFYQFLYMLPYFSTIRNPAKFTHTFHWALIILFAYGVHGISRLYLESSGNVTSSLRDHLKRWWARATGFERKWVAGSVVVFVLSVLGWLVYRTSHSSLTAHLQTVGFPDEGMAQTIADFSLREVAIYLLFLAPTLALIILILSGWFSGRRARAAGILLGLLLVVDLARANLPWVIYQDQEEKYASNEVIDLLRKEPHQQRVAILPSQTSGQLALFDQLYRIEWMQHHFQFYNIQSLDIVQMPRVPESMAAFEQALQSRGTPDTAHLLARRWQLTNTRYLLGATGYVEALNQQLDSAQRRFRVVMQFGLVPKPGVANPTRLEELTAEPRTNGVFALIEFTGALPRAKLYTQWRISTNDTSTLATLAAPDFDPAETVLVADSLPPSAPPHTLDTASPRVEFLSYAPRRIRLRAETDSPAVLLLNDHFNPNWRVYVAGKEEPLLRCNYIVRGVYVPAGTHEVEFHFQPPLAGLYISLAAIALGLGLIGFAALSHRRAGGHAADSEVREPAKNPSPV
jgi:hypothetical protein